MLLKITSKRQVTFPKRVMDELNLHEGETLSVLPAEGGFFIRPNRFDPKNLAPLKSKIEQDTAKPNISEIRHAASKKSKLRD